MFSKSPLPLSTRLSSAVRTSVVLLAAATVTACGPSPEDEKLMKEKMELEVERADILIKNRKNCPALQTELTAWRKKTADDRPRLALWWANLGGTARDKLNDQYKKEWDKHDLGLIAAAGCVDAVKAAVAEVK